MKVTWLDRLKNAVMTAATNRLMEAPMNTVREQDHRAVHDDQRARVLASELRGPTKDAHQTYLIRRSTQGWTNSPVIRHTITPERRP